MEFLILGLLSFSEMTIYDIKNRLHKNEYLLYSSSIGGIQAALKKLVEGGWVLCVAILNDTRKRKLYTITPLGKERFLQWLAVPTTVATQKSANIKLYFLGSLPHYKRQIILQSNISCLQEKLTSVADSLEDTLQGKIEAQQQDIEKFNVSAINLQVMLIKNELDWYRGLLEKTSNEQV